MSNLLKTELYKLFHSWYFWGIGIFNLLLSSILLLDSKERSSNLIMASLYNIPLLYFLSIVFIALFIGSDFSGRTLNTYITAGHKRSSIFRVKLIVSQIGCIIIADVGMFFYNIIKAIIYSCLLNSAIFLIAILICCYLQDAVKATSVTVIIIFGLSLYLGYGMMLRLPVGFLPTYQIRIVVSMKTFFQPIAILVGCIWSGILVLLSWIKFCKCDFK